ncbi:MAG TPA: hypothetical protein VHG91_21205 [Longimicrobium sp.]|nr:hypothetical protein [Longimicrobium sp.]
MDDQAVYDEVVKAVFASLEDLSVPPHKYRDPSVRLLELISGDEASFIFIPDIDKALGVVTPQKEWDNAYTLQDAIDLYVRAVKQRGEARPDEGPEAPPDAQEGWLARLFRCPWMPLLLLVLACGSPDHGRGAPPADERSGSSVQALVANEMTTGQAAWRETYGVIPPPRVTLEALPPSDGVRLWRAAGPLDHWTAYVVGEARGELVRLGGFDAPELERLSALQAREPLGDSADVVRRSRDLAALADAHGGERVVFAADPGPSGAAVVRRWENVRRASWPGDFARRLEGGRWLTRLTLLSQQVRSYEQDWVPYTYSFLFRQDGTVEAWSRRAGEGLMATEARRPAWVRDSTFAARAAIRAFRAEAGDTAALRVTMVAPQHEGWLVIVQRADGPRGAWLRVQPDGRAEIQTRIR